jgi:hypothetical protein
MLSAFGKSLGVLLLIYCPVNNNASEAAYEDTEADGEECQAGLRDGEIVWRRFEDDGECGEEGKQHREGEGCV